MKQEDIARIVSMAYKFITDDIVHVTDKYLPEKAEGQKNTSLS